MSGLETSAVYISDGRTLPMRRVPLGRGIHNEAWLQTIVHNNPSILPVEDIEPGFLRLIPIAKEVPVAHGYVDNFFLTANGEIVIAELKLWRNPQMRREVVAQCLDYVAALTAMTYDDLEHACLNGESIQEPKPKSLYELVEHWPDVLSEEKFIDAVAFNLMRGRILVIAAGDGIRQETHSLSDLLQSLTSAQFTFALVELAVYERGGDYLVCPNTLLKTETITRTVFLNGDSSSDNKSVRDSITPVRSKAQKSKTISEIDFFESLETNTPGSTDVLQAFLERLSGYGVYVDLKGALNLKHERPNSRNPINLGYVRKNGYFLSTPAGWSDLSKIGAAYHRAIADLIGGSVRADLPPEKQYVSTDGKKPPDIKFLLDEHQEGLLKIMRAYLKAVSTFDNRRTSEEL
jgi:hypothetical protein